MKFTLLGTGNGAMLPVYACQCKACQRAIKDVAYRRNKTSAMVEHNGKTLLIDANLPNLLQRFPTGTIDCILLTHYHIDHVQSLFDLRTGVGDLLPVHGPNDRSGCDDLYKHPGMLAFQTPFEPFEQFVWQGIVITTIPLNHSRICLGYVFEWQGKRIAYLTDTCGLSGKAIDWLRSNPIDWMFIDCGFAPETARGALPVRNHSSFEQIKEIQQSCNPKYIRLIHIDHQFETWAMETKCCFDEHLMIAQDEQYVDYADDEISIRKKFSFPNNF